MRETRSQRIFSRARAVMPGGVSSPVRAFGAVGGTPTVIASAKGALLIDEDGRELIDCIGAWGAAILGHAHPAVVEAVARAASRGSSFGTCAAGEVDLAERVVARMPAIERVRFTNSGTEAAMTALRLARAARSRPLVVKFDGCYHGHGDAMLVRAGSGAATLGVPDSAGVLPQTAGSTLVARYNDIGSVQDLAVRHRGQIAAILVEPVAGNMGLVPPVEGFLPGLRRIADDIGALLIFDEVMTGFRVARGGAQERFGVRPDLTILGKVLGGGLPVGAVGGPADLMDLLAPKGPVYSAGTFSGNPLTMAAGCAALDLLDEAAYSALESISRRAVDGLGSAIDASGTPACVQSVGSMLSIFLGRRAVRDMEDAEACDRAAFAEFFHAMLEEGVHLPPSGFESWFLSLAHDERTVDRIVAAAEGALSGLARAAEEAGVQASSPAATMPSAGGRSR